MLDSILFVDDEPKILEAYRRTLRKQFNVVSAGGGAEALSMMAAEGPYPVIVSDMAMPEMNGVELLGEIKSLYPDTMRLMLTGNADQKTAVDAINTVDVYRFLNKPCPPDEMASAIKSALRHYELAKAEQVLLEKTVKGSIKALVEVLSIASPKIFGHAATLRRYILACAKQLKLGSTWELEATALLSQIGVVTLPDKVVDRVLKGGPLTAEEQDSYDKHPEVAAKLVNRIPRLEAISEAVRYQNKGYDGSGRPAIGLQGDALPLAARLLKPIMDLVAGEAAGLSSQESYARLKSQPHYYDPHILAALAVVVGEKKDWIIKAIAIADLKENMRIASDVVTYSGALLVAKGQEVSPSLIERLRNFHNNQEIDDKINVFVSQ